MINIEVDFDAIREKLFDYIHFGAGQACDFVNNVVDAAEDLFDRLPDA